nr:MAG: hypothetical protein [Bacteriophage sp.]
MKKASKAQIIKWYEDGLSIDEFAPLVPQYCKPEIEAAINEYRKEKEWARLVTSAQH